VALDDAAARPDALRDGHLLVLTRRAAQALRVAPS
jgi:hypothetical protein